MEENTPDNTHPGTEPNSANASGSATEVSPQSPNNTVDMAALEKEAEQAINEAVLEKISNLSGRKFENWEDYEKHYQGVTKLAFNKAPKMDNPTPNSEEVQVLSQQVADMKDSLAKNQFLQSNPKALPVMDLVSKIAKADGVDYAKAYESIKDYAEAKLAQEEALAREQEPGITGSRLSPEKQQRIDEIATNLKGTTTPGGHTFAPSNRRQLEQDLVKEAMPEFLAELRK